MDDHGDLVFEYAPLPMSPMTVAELLLLGVVTLAAPVALPPELWPLGGACFLPLVAVLFWALLQWPSRTRIHARGIEISLPLWRRLLRQRAWFPWSEVRNVFPSMYEVAGSAMSPFASSAGTLVHTGLGLEATDGRRLTVRFMPGSIRGFRSESPGYAYAMAAVRSVFRDLGRPLVTEVQPYSDEDVLRMHEEARRPLLGMGTIVFAFLLPPTIVALGVAAADSLGLAAGAPFLLAVLALAALPPAAATRYTLGRSRRRNWLLSELAKHEEHARGRRA